jgi:hypothetical protein
MVLPVLVAVYIGVIAYNVRTTRTLQARVRSAVLDMLRDSDKAEADLEALSKHRFTFVAAEASVLLADCLERRGDFEGAIGHCDRAIACRVQLPARRRAAVCTRLHTRPTDRAKAAATTLLATRILPLPGCALTRQRLVLPPRHQEHQGRQGRQGRKGRKGRKGREVRK